MQIEQKVTSNDSCALALAVAMAIVKRRGRARKYENDAARVAACRARKNKKAVTFDLSPEVLEKLAEFMARRVDSKNPGETKSQVVERALNQFLRKR